MKLIPLFPLEIVVFPEEKLNLHIFEPRYRQLIEECEAGGHEFGIPYYQKDTVLTYGTCVVLEEIAKTYPDGRMDIRTRGKHPFIVRRFLQKYPQKKYPGGYTEEQLWDRDGQDELYTVIADKIDQLFDVLGVRNDREILKRPFITFEVAHKVGFTQKQEFQFLKIAGEVERQEFMNDHLDRIIPLMSEIQEVKKKIEMNGHFRNLIPPKL